MPDWTYQTVFRPLLKQLPYPVAQHIVFRTMGLLGTTVPGRAIIRFMGHARPPADVTVVRSGQQFPSPCGLGCGVDLSAQAVSAISLFGFGMIEVGPVGCHTIHPTETNATQWRGTALAIPDAVVPGSVAELSARLRTNAFRNGVTVVARLALVEDTTPAQIEEVCKHLDDSLDGYSVPLDLNHPDTTGPLLQALNNEHRLLFGIVTPQRLQESGSNLAEFLDQSPLDGVIIEGGIDSSGQRGLVGAEVIEQIIKAIRSVAVDDREWLLITSGGIEQPVDAMELLEAGADQVLVDSGFAIAGPGIPKRINNNVHASQRIPALKAQPPDDTPFGHRSWFWSFLLGLSLTIGGIAAVILGWTRVLLPYDEEFLGMLRDEICGINDQLLPFMSHDRVTLAGTMLSLGPLYLALAWFGDRRGMRWARSVVLTSGFIGFLSFFLFLGFGYFDPFHAFIAAVLFQFITLCLRSTQPGNLPVEYDLRNSPSWYRAMWGQLLMVLHGAAILIAGVVISSFGVTTVFVPEDLEFMQTTREYLVDANPRLVPLVAHDRASFGGMLISTGIAVLLTALWGWQRGRRWLWCSLIGTGTVAYTTTIVIHWAVGYVNLKHLLPAYGGLVVLWIAMGLSRSWMFEDAAVMARR